MTREGALSPGADWKEIYLIMAHLFHKSNGGGNFSQNFHSPGEVPDKEKEEDANAFLCISAFALLSLDSQNLAAVVGTAGLASSVGHDGFTALGANRNAGSGQLPVGATALIAASLGHFTLGDSHGDTSLVKLLSGSINVDLLLKKLP